MLIQIQFNPSAITGILTGPEVFTPYSITSTICPPDSLEAISSTLLVSDTCRKCSQQERCWHTDWYLPSNALTKNDTGARKGARRSHCNEARPTPQCNILLSLSDSPHQTRNSCMFSSRRWSHFALVPPLRRLVLT